MHPFETEVFFHLGTASRQHNTFLSLLKFILCMLILLLWVQYVRFLNFISPFHFHLFTCIYIYIFSEDQNYS